MLAKSGLSCMSRAQQLLELAPLLTVVGDETALLAPGSVCTAESSLKFKASRAEVRFVVPVEVGLVKIKIKAI